jgi:3-oxoacyl-[acyl-carrier protein] reductase
MGAPLKAGGVEARIPVGRMGQAQEVAEATVMIIGNGFLLDACYSGAVGAQA